jgi:DNA modification methylase
MANDNLGQSFEKFLRGVCVNILTVAKGAIYICMSSSELQTLYEAFTDAGGHWSTFLIWSKNTFMLGRSDYQRQFEPILYGWHEGGAHYWCGARDQGDVWYVNKPHSNDLHPTMKPVELVERTVHNSSRRCDVILDPFGGAASTLIACEKIGRQERLIEIDPQYIDVSVRRWLKFTGCRATLEGDGRTFAEVAQARMVPSVETGVAVTNERSTQ